MKALSPVVLALAVSALEAFAADAAPGRAPAAGPREPTWLQGLPAGQWHPISLNTLSDVDPENDPALNPNFVDRDGDGRSERNAPWRLNSGQRCVLACWNGGAFASAYGASGALLLFGGGHGGYRGNEVYAFDMATLRWERVTDPYPGDEIDSLHGAYADGSPLPPHTYDGVGYAPASHAFVVLRGVADNIASTLRANRKIAYQLDLRTKTWRRSPLHDGANLHGGASAYDQRRGVFVLLGTYNSALTVFDPRGDNGDGTRGRYSHYAAHPLNIDNTAAIDPVHDLIVYTAFRSGGSVQARFLDDLERGPQVLEQRGDIPARRGQNGWEWSQKLRGFVYWASGTANVFLFSKDRDERYDPAWTWTDLTSPSNEQMPEVTRNGSGSYSRFQLAHYGDEELAVVVNRVDAAVWAFRLP